MKLLLHYEAKPWKVNQPWGVFNDIYKRFGFSRHNGVDITPGKDKLLRAPFECEVTKIAFQPTGAGHYICLLSENEYEDIRTGDRKKFFVERTYMHLEKTLVPVGSKLSIGTAFAVCDNTGFSTGPHTHIASKRVKKVPGGYVEIDSNEAKNTFDCTQFYSGRYALDVGAEKLHSNLSILRQKVEAILAKLKS